MRRSLFGMIAVVLLPTPVTAMTQSPDASYWVYVAAESADQVHLIRFGPDGAALEKTLNVGEIFVETEGPHGLRISPDRKYLYMTTGHGIPDGKLWKYETGSDVLVAEPILLGRFPATLDLTPDGLYAFVVNFNLHGEHVPSSISVVYTPTLTEVSQTETCTMPHGSRIHPNGIHLYSACMMDDQVVEVDTRTFEVVRRLNVSLHNGEPTGTHAMSSPTCSPTWAIATPTGDRIFVACNKGNVILEVDHQRWKVERHLNTPAGPYNLAITPDERLLIATLKQSGAVSFVDLETLEIKGVESTSTTVTHGVEVSPDSRYAFVSSEGVGAEPGKVDIFDLRSLHRVASVDVAQQAGGIAFWKMEPN